MAESLAFLHGNPKGIVAHHDLDSGQYLLDKNGHLKLNDFNKARILPWNVKEKRYCKFFSNADEVLRAPEEIFGGFADDSSDVVSLGKIMYTLLTGLIPYYDKSKSEDALKAIVDGEKPFIDERYRTRSFIEGRLCEIMERCWKPKKRVDRITVFDVIADLRETARLANITDDYLEKGLEKGRNDFSRIYDESKSTDDSESRDDRDSEDN